MTAQPATARPQSLRQLARWSLQAQRPRRESWREEDYVELDDEPDWDEEVQNGLDNFAQSASLAFHSSRCLQDAKPGTSIQSILSGLLPQAVMLSDKISEFVFYFFPEGTSRTAVG